MKHAMTFVAAVCVAVPVGAWVGPMLNPPAPQPDFPLAIRVDELL